MGDRHINIFGLTQAADAQSGAPPSESNAAKRAQVTSSAAQSAVPAAEAPEARGSALLAEAVNGEPRAQLTCEQATELVAAAAYNHAAPIIKLLPSYLHPLLATAPMSEVRSLFVNRCLGDTCALKHDPRDHAWHPEMARHKRGEARDRLQTRLQPIKTFAYAVFKKCLCKSANVEGFAGT